MEINKELIKEYLTTPINKNNIWKKYYGKKDTGVLLKWLRHLNIDDKKIIQSDYDKLALSTDDVFEKHEIYNKYENLITKADNKLNGNTIMNIQYQSYLRESAYSVFDQKTAKKLDEIICNCISKDELEHIAEKLNLLLTLSQEIISDIDDTNVDKHILNTGFLSISRLINLQENFIRISDKIEVLKDKINTF